MIEANNGYGLAKLGEGKLESFHKILKRFYDRLTRKTNLANCLTDLFNRLYLHSSPFIRSKRPKRNKNSKKPNEMKYEDDRIVAEFLISE
jgi:hypothetical protein